MSITITRDYIRHNQRDLSSINKNCMTNIGSILAARFDISHTRTHARVNKKHGWLRSDMTTYSTFWICIHTRDLSSTSKSCTNVKE